MSMAKVASEDTFFYELEESCKEELRDYVWVYLFHEGLKEEERKKAIDKMEHMKLGDIDLIYEAFELEELRLK